MDLIKSIILHTLLFIYFLGNVVLEYKIELRKRTYFPSLQKKLCGYILPKSPARNIERC